MQPLGKFLKKNTNKNPAIYFKISWSRQIKDYLSNMGAVDQLVEMGFSKEKA